jgi:hypothetical protein
MINFANVPRQLRELYTVFRKFGLRAYADNGVSPAGQLLEMMRLRLGPGKLEPEDYYRMRVYRRDLDFDAKGLFLSQRAVALSHKWTIVADDKLLAYRLLEHEGIKTPEIHAICEPLRTYRDRPALRSADEIVAYLHSGARYPFIAKPSTGIFSQDVRLVSGFDAASGCVQLAEEATLDASAFARGCIERKNGTIFQELLLPHPRIAAEISTRLCTMRLIVLLERDHCWLFRAYLKVASGGNVADNYWRPGNFIATLDMATGAIKQCATGLGPDFRVLDSHPVTGRPLAGFAVPFYAEAVELVLRAARIFPGIRMQAWDVAITPAGPIPLELNVEGSVFLPQAADQRGMGDQAVRNFLTRSRLQLGPVGPSP